MVPRLMFYFIVSTKQVSAEVFLFEDRMLTVPVCSPEWLSWLRQNHAVP